MPFGEKPVLLVGELNGLSANNKAPIGEGGTRAKTLFASFKEWDIDELNRPSIMPSSRTSADSLYLLHRSHSLLEGLEGIINSTRRSIGSVWSVLSWALHLPYFMYTCITLLWEVAAGILGVPMVTPEYRALERQLERSKTYPEWRAVGRMLDDIDGYQEWRTEERSIYFNFEGIMQSMQVLLELRREGNALGLLEALSTRVHRSIYGINNSQLYRFRTGTKNVIHSYTSLSCFLIREMASDSFSIPLAERIRAVSQMREVYGTTALVLSGGTVVAPLHLGVAKALYAAGLLPQVLYGCRCGAMVAALIGCTKDIRSLDAGHLNFAAISGKDSLSTTTRRFRRLLTHGHLMDSTVLLTFMRDNIGDLTFTDAYRLTGRIINIQYTALFRSEKTGRVRRCSCLLNYLTAPNVLVYSAAVSSMTSVAVVFQRVPLLARNLHGETVEYDPSVLLRSYPQPQSDSSATASNSLHRLRQLFHVQYFIISECSMVNCHPSLERRWQRHVWIARFFSFLYVSVLRLMWMIICWTPVEPYVASALDNDIESAVAANNGDVTLISPRLSLYEMYRMWGSLSPAEMRRCVAMSERQVWPRLEEVRMSRNIERTLALTYKELRESARIPATGRILPNLVPPDACPIRELGENL